MSDVQSGIGVNRRDFMKIGAVTAMTMPASSYGRILGANDRINIGVIGCGNRSADFMNAMLKFIDEENFAFTALCDVSKKQVKRRRDWLKQNINASPKTFSRYNDLLDSKDVDAVMIATPDHAHTPILIAACDSGKDVFCEKPMSMDVNEASDAVEAVHRNDRICQIGTQRRSDGIHMTIAKYIREGNLGQVVQASLKWNDNSPRWERDYSDVTPDDVDWEAFLMHREYRQFDPRRYRCWHLYRDYSIGIIGVLGAHLTDLVHWYCDQPYPVSAVGTGATLVWKNREQYDTIIATYQYPNGMILNLEHRLGNSSMRAESIFYGTQGIIYNGKVSAEGAVDPAILKPTGTVYATSPLASGSQDNPPEIVFEPDPAGIDHNRNWIRSLRSRKQPNATVEAGYAHSIVAIMGHRAADTGKRLIYDPASRTVQEG